MQRADAGPRPVEGIGGSLAVVVVVQLGVPPLEREDRPCVVVERLLADPHPTSLAVVLYAEGVPVCTALEVEIELEALLAAILRQRQVLRWKLILDTRAPRHQRLDPTQRVQHRCLAGTVGTEEDIRLVQPQLEIDETPKVVDIESREHHSVLNGRGGGRFPVAGRCGFARPWRQRRPPGAGTTAS